MTSNHQSALAEDAPPEQVTKAIDDAHHHYLALRKELGQVIVGMDDVAEQLMMAILCRGHCILQGMPGLAKTLLISTIASLMDLTFHRIQFTPDLMPADITGSEVIEEDRSTGRREFRFIKGPIFANIVLADEVNRTPPKSQSALLEAMEERQLSIAGKTYRLPDLFFVLATQNPVEVEGTYPLPEAQLDRFLFKVKVSYPSRDSEREICRRNVSGYAAKTSRVIDETTLKMMQGMVTKVIVSDHVYNAAIDPARATRPEEGMLPKELKDMVQWGAGPRASIALLMAAKARALLQKRVHATTDDVWAVALPVLRHRIIPTFQAEAAGVDNDKIVAKIVQQCRGAVTKMSWFRRTSSGKRRAPLVPGVNDSSHGAVPAPHGAAAADQLLDPATLARLGSFELIAQTVVDGVMSGKHRSLHKGGCCEFSEHRAYTQGDETRLIDWRLFARRDRYYVKLFDDETNLRAWMVVDSSASMGFGLSTATKFDYARAAAACLGRMLLRQRDSVGLVCDIGGRTVRLPPRPQASAFQGICEALRHAAPRGSRSLPQVLSDLPSVVKRRGMVLVFSDCFGDLAELSSSLKLLRLRGHDVVVFQVLAPEEQTFSFRAPAVFEDLERVAPRLRVDPGQTRRRYLERFQAFQLALKTELTQAGCDLCVLSTGDDLGHVLSHFLSYRAAMKKARARASV